MSTPNTPTNNPQVQPAAAAAAAIAVAAQTDSASSSSSASDSGRDTVIMASINKDRLTMDKMIKLVNQLQPGDAAIFEPDPDAKDAVSYYGQDHPTQVERKEGEGTKLILKAEEGRFFGPPR